MNNSTLTIKDWNTTIFSQEEQITAIYCRLSAEDGNEGESNSIANQRQILGNFALRENLPNPIFFVDDGFSGSNFTRPAISKLLELVEIGKVSTVIVKDLSRLGRDYLRVGQLLESVFPSNNVRFISLNEQVDSLKSSAQDAYMLPLMNIFNEWYSRQCSEKIKLSKHTKAKNGEKIGWMPPYGYLKSPENPKQWIVDEVASKVVKRIFQEFLNGKTPTEIAQGLRKDKILTPAYYKNKIGLTNHPVKNPDPYHWRECSITKMLDQEEYIGSTVNLKTSKLSYKQRNFKINPREKWLVFPDKHEAIISKEDFETVRKMRASRRIVQRYNWATQKGHENLFSGLVYCENGHKLSFCPQQKQDINVDHYKCYHYTRINQSCSGYHYIRKNVLEGVILADINPLLSQINLDEEEFLNRMKEKFHRLQDDQQEEFRKQFIEKKRRYQELEVILQNLYEKQLLGIIDDERAKKLTEKYEIEQAELNKAIRTCNNQMKQETENSKNIERFMKTVREYHHLENLTPRIIHELIDRIIIHQPIGRGKNRQLKIEIHYRFLGKL